MKLISGVGTFTLFGAVESFRFALHRPSMARLYSTMNPLRIVIVGGSTRKDGPPFPAPLGNRVLKFVEQEISRRGHDTVVIDPLQENLSIMNKPHFAYKSSDVPENLQEIAAKFKNADGYIMCTPEYNHAPGPALLNTLAHFGSSLFSFKPSAIVSYSAGQWGGTRAAHALRPVLSELGCIPVSAMIHIPKAQQVFDEDGNILDDKALESWRSYVNRSFSQLEWWAEAAKEHKKNVDPLEVSPVFGKDPSQRDAA
mmetsp:Transcript_16986/g.28462  ORF Transcript_16986/g.28462 Transcript_16986/m.28462 type:complete len:255 (-) Transcript_16986:233-997(-)